MGATNCPETPRQRMIGMMYLVLTAMLALNVSKDILNSFVTVDETLKTSTEVTEKTIAGDRSMLEGKYQMNQAKFEGAVKNAGQLQSYSDEMVNYIEKVRVELLDAADGGSKVKLDEKGKVDETAKSTDPEAKDWPTKTAVQIEAKDQNSAATNFFFPKTGTKKAEELKEKILEYRNNILSLVDAKDRPEIEKQIGLDVISKHQNLDGKELSWEEHSFEHQILIACVTLLNKLEGEVRNAQSSVLKYIAGAVDANAFKFDDVRGKALAQSGIVFQGSPYTAEIFIAALDTKQNPEVYYKMGVDTLRESETGGATKIDGTNGMAILNLTANTLGESKYAGLIKIKKPDGTDGWYSFKNKFDVIAPSATVAAEKMNVLYAGLSNPLSVSGSIAQERLSVTVAGCTVTKTATGWDVTVPVSQIGKEVIATVMANIDGKTTNMGTKPFRVKKVPDPKPVIGQNIKGGRQSKADITANALLRADMGEDFVYNLKWDVVSYTAYVSVRGIETPFQCNGPRFSQDLVNEIQKASRGTAIFFDNIKVKSAAGERNLDGFSVRIK